MGTKVIFTHLQGVVGDLIAIRIQNVCLSNNLIK